MLTHIPNCCSIFNVKSIAFRLTISFIFVTLLCFSNSIKADGIVVAIKKTTQPSPPITRYTLAAIFGMRLTTWPDGTAIRVFVLPDDNILHNQFCKQVLQVFPFQMRNAWDRLVFSGTGQSPEVLNSEQEMKIRISNTPGSIGYLPKEKIDDSVSILKIE
jgi:ABC-type phosphate transport system substrate-binding protein